MKLTAAPGCRARIARANSGMDRTRDQVLRTQWMGRRLRRFEDAALVTGKGVFVDDLPMPEMLWIEFARSNHPRGRILRLNTIDAENFPGVVSVMKGETPGVFGHAAVNRVLPHMRLLPFPLLPVSEINAVGQPIAAVIATARRGCRCGGAHRGRDRTAADVGESRAGLSPALEFGRYGPGICLGRACCARQHRLRRVAPAPLSRGQRWRPGTKASRC